MADWSQLVKGFQGGAEFSQNFRANRQLEKAREQALERGEYDLESQRAFRKTTNPDAASELGEDYAAQNMDWNGQLEDPFAFKLFDWFKGKFGKNKKKAASDTGEDFAAPIPVEDENAPAQAYAYGDDYADGGQIGYADGGEVSEDEKVRERARQNRARTPGRVENATETVQGADRTAQGATRTRKALDVASKVKDTVLDRAKLPEGAGLGRRALTGASRIAGRAGAIAALGATAVETARTPTEAYRKRFGLETNDPSLMGDIGVRALGAASDLGNVLTGGLAGRLYRDKQKPAAVPSRPQALPVEQQSAPNEFMAAGEPQMASRRRAGEPQMASRRRAALPTRGGSDPTTVDFGTIDIDAKDVPNMQTDDWKKYRAQMIAAAQKSGDPSAVARVNDMVTDMQMKGFMSYGQQGLALQQAGNVRGAMAAYRAAFQYFPNGNDVEFGTSKDKRTGRTQIVGFGRDEKSNKIVPGSELVMDPERVATLLENFKNPAAFRAWTKDWRDFKQEERKYEEVTKPLAQAQADYMATNSEANVLRAENAGLRAGAGASASGMRNAERVFRERLGMLGLQDEAQADYLASVMSQVKAANPNVPDNTIVQVIMTAAKDGTLNQRLQRLGIGGAAPRQQALPTQSDEMPEGVDPESWNATAGLPYDERVQASTPAR